jgi:hypothetical protein
MDYEIIHFTIARAKIIRTKTDRPDIYVQKWGDIVEGDPILDNRLTNEVVIFIHGF